MFYGAIVLAVAVSTIACNDSKKGEIVIDGKTYTISINEITHNGSSCDIMLNVEKEIVEKFHELKNSPFGVGIISNGKYTSARWNAVFDESVLFQTNEAPGKLDKIVVYSLDYKSVIEFDPATKEVLPGFSEELEELVKSQDSELCKKFESYQPVSPEQNKAGISFQLASGQVSTQNFGVIKYDNTRIKSSERFANEFTVHFFAVDADEPTKKLNVHLRGGHSFDNTEFFGFILFDGDIDAKYALIGFEGTGRGVPADIETPSLFYVVELGDKYTDDGDTYTAIKAYCKTPYLAGSIFDGLDL